MQRKNTWKAISLIPVIASAKPVLAAFPAPITDSPIGNYTAEIDAGSGPVSYSEPIGLNPTTFAIEPDVYWFKYVSNGQNAVTFDTLGSDFGTNGPGGPGGGGAVLGSYNESQIAVYTATGACVAISKNTVDLNGDPIPIYPTYSSDSTQWYYPEGLTQLHFEPNAPTDPHWSVSPTDPTPYTGWAAPGNSGNSQKYYPPYYHTSLNEYHVWSTALSPIILDNNGNPVINPDTGQPYTQPGWRYFDYARVGPGSTWNRYDVLPAGTYYVAVASDGPVFAGDTYTEKVLESPIFYDASTGQNYVPQLTGDLGTWQYYDNNTSSVYWGTIKLNVTQTALPAQLLWNNAGGSGDGQTWDVATNVNWNNGTAPTTFSAGADVAYTDSNNGHYAVVLNSTITPGSVFVNNSSGNYTISGTGSIVGSGNLDKTGTGTLTLSTVNSFTGGTAVDGGTLVAGVNGALPTNQALEIHNTGVVKLANGTGATTLSSLSISDGATLDITNNHVFINYGSGFDPISTIASYLVTGCNGGTWNGTGIISSAAQTKTNGLSYGVGYADGADGRVSGLSSGQIEVMYTLLGDANLDGLVNAADFTILAANFNQPVTGWDQGDFNYDGLVNAADFTDLAANFNQTASGADASASDVAALDAFAAANGFSLANVPEPASAAMMVMAGLGILRRRRRSSRQSDNRPSRGTFPPKEE